MSKPNKKGSKKGPDPSNCPKCKKVHSTVPQRPTLCDSCQVEAQERKAIANDKRAKSELAKRLPNTEPLSLKNLKNQKTIKSGDIVVRTSDGYFFFPGDVNFDQMVESVFALCKGAKILSDWGGVAALFLQQNKKYLKKPQKLRTIDDGCAWVFSYTPVGKLGELDLMWLSASASGFEGMVITTQKGVNHKGKAIPGEIGKHQFLAALLKFWTSSEGPNYPIPDYYEDTASVLDNLVNIAPGMSNNFWVRPKDKEFRDMVPTDDSIIWIEHEEFLEKILE